jgi:hypothetical protein
MRLRSELHAPRCSSHTGVRAVSVSKSRSDWPDAELLRRELLREGTGAGRSVRRAPPPGIPDAVRRQGVRLAAPFFSFASLQKSRRTLASPMA